MTTTELDTSNPTTTHSTAVTAPPDAGPGRDRPRPHALNEQWRDAFNAGDLTALMDTYEPDALIVPGPGAEPVRGHDAIAAALGWFLSLGGTLRFTPRHWLVQDDIVFSSVAFVMDGGRDSEGQPVELHGVTCEVLRQQPDGAWRYVIDHPFGGADAGPTAG